MDKRRRSTNDSSVEAAITKFFDRSLRKTLKRSYYDQGVSLRFMKNELIDQFSRMAPTEIYNLMNSDRFIKDTVFSQIADVFSRLVEFEKNRRVSETKHKIAYKIKQQKQREQEKKRQKQEKKRQEKIAEQNRKKRDAIKALKKSLPKKEFNKFYKLFPIIRDDWDNNY